jgi:hypothetical protein
MSPAQADELAELMDAVHNIPHLIGDWERCDESLLRGMLQDYDAAERVDSAARRHSLGVAMVSAPVAPTAVRRSG